MQIKQKSLQEIALKKRLAFIERRKAVRENQLKTEMRISEEINLLLNEIKGLSENLFLLTSSDAYLEGELSNNWGVPVDRWSPRTYEDFERIKEEEIDLCNSMINFRLDKLVFIWPENKPYIQDIRNKIFSKGKDVIDDMIESLDLYN